MCHLALNDSGDRFEEDDHALSPSDVRRLARALAEQMRHADHGAPLTTGEKVAAFSVVVLIMAGAIALGTWIGEAVSYVFG